MSKEEIKESVKILENYTTDLFHSYKEEIILKAIRNLIKGYKELEQEKEKNKELEKQNKILEVEKVRYNIQYLESAISQTPDTAMTYYSMKKNLETLKEEKIKLETELQELLEGE